VVGLAGSPADTRAGLRVLSVRADGVSQFNWKPDPRAELDYLINDGFVDPEGIVHGSSSASGGLRGSPDARPGVRVGVLAGLRGTGDGAEQ